VEHATSIEVDKITEVLIDGLWHPVIQGTLLLVPFELAPEHLSVPGIGFQSGPKSEGRNREAIYAPLSSVSAVKTVDDTRTHDTGV